MDLARRVLDIGRPVDDGDDVAGANAGVRGAAGLPGAHVAGRPRDGQEVDLGHQLVRHLFVDLGEHLHEVQRRADLAQLGVNVPQQQRTGRSPLGRGRDDDRVAALQGHHHLVGRRRRRVGGRCDRPDHADGLGDLRDPLPLVHAYDPDGPRRRFEKVPQRAKRLALVLDNLVLDVPEPGVLDRHPRQLLGPLLLDDRPRHSLDHLVYPLLVVSRNASHGRPGPGDQPGNYLGGVQLLNGRPRRIRSGFLGSHRLAPLQFVYQVNRQSGIVYGQDRSVKRT